ncbi:hypothetical protein SDC9_64805 [bioreactor metagenome]|uniref:Division initiation protein n=1 Tax=bioreactor metagenome TaxID=1076179 RepID=A0A644XQB7_9ZZZZ
MNQNNDYQAEQTSFSDHTLEAAERDTGAGRPDSSAKGYGKRGFAGKFAVFCICLLFGFLVAMQFKSVKLSVDTVQNNQLMRAEELQTLLNKERQKNEQLYGEILQYKDDLSKYREQALTSGDYAEVLAQQLIRSELVAGMTDVEGPGITVTMTDSQIQITTEYLNDPNYYIIHDTDILSVVNELRDAGAEAIAINGERLIATSEIRCAGSIVSVNNNRYAAPYVITAIGDPDALAGALQMRGGVVDQLAPWGIGVGIEKNELIQIKGYTGGITFKYATPTEGSEN